MIIKVITNTFTKKHVIDFIKSSLDIFDKKIEPKKDIFIKIVNMVQGRLCIFK